MRRPRTSRTDSVRPGLSGRIAILALALALVLAGFGDALRHAHDGPAVEPNADCVVDHQRHESLEHSTPIDEPHVEADGAKHEHGCVACHGSRIRVAFTDGFARAPLPTFAERPFVDQQNSPFDARLRLPSPRGPPSVRIS